MNINKQQFFLNRKEIVDSLTKEGNNIKDITTNSGQHLLVKCQVCFKINYIKAQSVYRSFTKSWHKSYRCDKCINIGRKYSKEQCNNISKSNKGNKHSQKRIVNIINAIRKIDHSKKKQRFLYNEKVFRSSYEVRCAKIFDKFNIKYQYESKILSGTIFNENVKYIPDFYLPDLKIFVEVKGRWWSDKSKKKFDYFKNKLKDKLIIVYLNDLIEVENDL